MVHVTNGDSVGQELRRWAGEPRLIVWRDALHEGPVRAGLSLDDLSAERAAWFAAQGYPDEHLAARNKSLSHLASRDSLWLWFEDDLYDQLQLLQVLDWLRAEQYDTAKPHFLITIPRSLTVDQMAGLAAEKTRLTPVMFDVAVQAWAAFRSPDPAAVPDLLERADLSALPDLRPALERLLEHRPQRPDGLNRTERAIVEVLREQGPRTAHHLFVATQHLEERPFLGDTTFFWYLDRMAPLVQRDPHGLYQLHEGARKAPQARWVGGIEFLPDPQ